MIDGQDENVAFWYGLIFFAVSKQTKSSHSFVFPITVLNTAGPSLFTNGSLLGPPQGPPQHETAADIDPVESSSLQRDTDCAGV